MLCLGGSLPNNSFSPCRWRSRSNDLRSLRLPAKWQRLRHSSSAGRSRIPAPPQPLSSLTTEAPKASRPGSGATKGLPRLQRRAAGQSGRRVVRPAVAATAGFTPRLQGRGPPCRSLTCCSCVCCRAAQPCLADRTSPHRHSCTQNGPAPPLCQPQPASFWHAGSAGGVLATVFITAAMAEGAPLLPAGAVGSAADGRTPAHPRLSAAADLLPAAEAAPAVDPPAAAQPLDGRSAHSGESAPPQPPPQQSTPLPPPQQQRPLPSPHRRWGVSLWQQLEPAPVVPPGDTASVLRLRRLSVSSENSHANHCISGEALQPCPLS